ncbi:MAG: hypothetical protein OEN00_08570, partial [Gemmatimonadota bacterium]|nr:hypothetical protein [Gemmatimonadota bacterium]
MTVIAQEARIRIRVPDVVRDEVECVGNDLPVWNQLGDILVDREVGVLVHDVPNGPEVPSEVRIEREGRQVEGFGRRQHEEVSHTWILVDP